MPSRRPKGHINVNVVIDPEIQRDLEIVRNFVSRFVKHKHPVTSEAVRFALTTTAEMIEKEAGKQ